MNTFANELESALDFELHLMTSALYFGEFAAVQPLLKSDTRLAQAIKKNDLATIRKLTRSLITVPESLDETQQQAFSESFQTIQNKYATVLQQQAIPIPEDFLHEVASLALDKQKYLSAHNILNSVKKLEKGINELLNHAVQRLQSREVSEGNKENATIINRKIEESAFFFYKALRLKYPLGLNFQYRGVDFFLSSHDAKRKYERYVEQGESVLKEIIHSCLLYLTNDPVLTDKINNQIKNNRIRKQFLKKLAVLMTGSEEKFRQFVANYLRAKENVRNARTEYDYPNTQRILLGRSTGSDTLVQYLKELATSFPISPMLITIANSPENVSYLAPLMLKEKSILEILDLDK